MEAPPEPDVARRGNGNDHGHKKGPVRMREARIFAAQPTVLSDVRRFIQEQAKSASLPADAAGDLVIAASEAAANSALYSNSAEFEVGWQRQDHRVEVEVADRGVFRRKLPFSEGEEDPGRGRGIQLMVALMDEVDVRHGSPHEPGTLVRLVKYLS
jgi:anti-sigma regulatory factor (Ser/Thr protein kinase)